MAKPHKPTPPNLGQFDMPRFVPLSKDWLDWVKDGDEDKKEMFISKMQVFHQRIRKAESLAEKNLAISEYLMKLLNGHEGDCQGLWDRSLEIHEIIKAWKKERTNINRILYGSIIGGVIMAFFTGLGALAKVISKKFFGGAS